MVLNPFPKIALVEKCEMDNEKKTKGNHLTTTLIWTVRDLTLPRVNCQLSQTELEFVNSHSGAGKGARC